jgi:arylsulfatase A-like enzyme
MARCWLLLAVIVVGSGVACRPERPPRERPNIILVMADDLGYETLRVNGGTSYRTPHLDALARSGMRFTQAYATPLCTPTRVQLMTGQYNFRNYIGFGLLDPEERTVAHLLQAAGYRTAVVGKWQLFGNERQRALAGGRVGTLPRQAGFDEYALWQVEARGSRYKDPYLEIVDGSPGVHPGRYGPDVFAEYIERFLERHQHAPFFLYYPMVLPHEPFQPTPDDPDYATFDPGDGLNDPRYFASHVAYLDDVIGRIVRQLERLELREHTLLIFTADNGTDRDVTSRLGDRVVQGRKGYTTEAGTHVPLIASWPSAIEPDQVNDNLIDFTDFLPTLLDAAQVERWSEDLIADGLSFFPQLLGTAGTVRSWVFCHYAPNWGNFPDRRLAHNREWKLYADGSFYHIAEDPEEQHHVPDEELTGEVRRIRQGLQGVLDRMSQDSLRIRAVGMTGVKTRG